MHAVGCFLFIVWLLFQAAPGRADPVILSGPEPIGWSAAACARWDVPDAPLRGWRGGDGAPRWIAAGEVARIARGADPATAAHDCAVLLEGAKADDPGAYDDRYWLASPHVAGPRVEALVHAEYHGHARPGRCAGDYLACWRNAIVAVEGPRDGGGAFARVGLVAALPYRYDTAAGRRTGYFNPSNVVTREGYLHAFFFAEAYRAQRRGVCVMRRPRDGAAGDWRGWDGTGFTVRFVDPYRAAVSDPAAHVCAPLAGLTGTLSSVVYQPESGWYFGVSPMTAVDAAGRRRSGIYWTRSRDLLNWSRPKLLWEAPLLWRRLGAREVYAYPSLIDLATPSDDFDTIGRESWLYLTRIRLDAAGRAGPDRDLVRLRLRLDP
jgi:hypothetical protein